MDSKEVMSNVLLNLSSNTITSELLFILRKSGKQRKYHFVQENRRPSILDILMDSAPKGDKTRSDERGINTQQQTIHSSSSLFHFTRRSSAPEPDSSFMEPIHMSRSNSNTPMPEKRKESLKQQLKRLVGWGSSANSTHNTKKQLSVVTSQSDIVPHSAPFTPKSRQGSHDNTASRFEVVNSPLSADPVMNTKQVSTVSLVTASTHEDTTLKIQYKSD